MKNILFTTFSILFLVFAVCAADFSETRHLKLDAKGISVLEIDCEAGILDIRGFSNTDQIEVKAEIYIEADREQINKIIKENLELTLEQKGSRAILKSGFEMKDNSFWDSLKNLGGISKRIDLKVKLPAEMDLLIDDGSGAIEIQDISGRIEIDDGSGDMEIKNITGSVKIDDGSGTCLLRDIKGDVYVDDGSGTLIIENIGSNVTVDDGSGGIEIDGVRGDVTIEDAGSGGLSIRNVDGRIRNYDD